MAQQTFQRSLALEVDHLACVGIQGRFVVLDIFDIQADIDLRLALGLAVGVLPQCLVESGMRLLDASDGFPPLPESRHGLIIGDHAPVVPVFNGPPCLKSYGCDFTVLFLL